MQRDVCLIIASGRRTSSLSQRLCFIMNEWRWSPRAAVLIDTGPSGFDVCGVVVAERDGLLITALSLSLLLLHSSHLPRSERRRLQGERVSHVRGIAEAKRGQRGGLRTSPNQTPFYFLPRLGGTP